MTTTTLIATPNPDDNPLLAAALAAAVRGWHVFPLAPNSKVPALHRADRCPRTRACTDGHAGWEQRATTDPDRIRAAWSVGRAYNIGLATGPSGLVVIDLDVSDPGEAPPPPWDQQGVRDGQDVLALLADQADQPYPGDTLTVTTPSGGLHLYFTAPGGIELRNTGGDRGRGLGWKVDTRAHGGYVVASGSRVDGRAYTVLHDQPPAPLPGWLVERLAPAPAEPPKPPTSIRTASRDRRSRYLRAAIELNVAKVTDATKGSRNTCLWGASVALGQLVAGNTLNEDEVVNELFAAAWKHIAVGAFTQSQAMATIRSGLRDGAKNPRQVA
jgi:hypothetical protein